MIHFIVDPSKVRYSKWQRRILNFMMIYLLLVFIALPFICIWLIFYA